MSPTAKPRQLQKLSRRVQRDLSLYAAAASAAGVSALALASPADAQIVYTPAHAQLTPGGSMPVDLNNDGVTDFTVNQVRYLSGFSFNRLAATPSPHGGIKKGVDEYPALAAAMLPGSNIGASDAFVHGEAIMASTSAYSSAVFGSWLVAKNCYLGVQFHINGETHYGWARFNVASFGIDHELALLTGYAYETRANKSIPAGDEGKGEDAAATNEEISNRPAKGTLSALAEGSANYCPFAGNPGKEGKH
jgi:hypothetical protein